MDGIRTDASGNYEVWGEAGGSYSATGIAPPIYFDPNYYGQSILTGGMFDSLFLADALVWKYACMIPDSNGVRPPTDNTGRVCSSQFSAAYEFNGAFSSFFNNLSSRINIGIGSRLAKW